MKKILALVLCIALFAVLAVPVSAVVNITANKASVVIDGVLDDAYAGPYDIAAHFQKPDESNNMRSATGKAWIAWDESALYYYLEIYDKTPNQKDDANADNVEMFIDWNNVTATGNGGEITGRNEADDGWDYNPGTEEGYPFWQVRVPAGPNLDGFQDINGAVWTDLGWGGVDWSAADAAERSTFVTLPIDGDFKNGYIIEIKIGLPDGVTLSEGKVIPIDFQICDNMNGEGTRDGQAFLEESQYNDMQWAVPSTLMGRLTLGGAYVAAAVVEEAAPAVVEEAGVEEAAPVAVVDDTPAPPPPPAPTAPKVGDSALMLVILTTALAGACFVTRRVRNRV